MKYSDVCCKITRESRFASISIKKLLFHGLRQNITNPLNWNMLLYYNPHTVCSSKWLLQIILIVIRIQCMLIGKISRLLILFNINLIYPVIRKYLDYFRHTVVSVVNSCYLFLEHHTWQNNRALIESGYL